MQHNRLKTYDKWLVRVPLELPKMVFKISVPAPVSHIDFLNTRIYVKMQTKSP